MMDVIETEKISVYCGEGAFKHFEKKYGKPKYKIKINSFDGAAEVERKIKEVLQKEGKK